MNYCNYSRVSISNDYNADAALLESCRRPCNLRVASRGGGCLSHPGRRAVAPQGFCVGCSWRHRSPRGQSHSVPRGSEGWRRTPISCLHPREMHLALHAQARWARVLLKAILHPHSCQALGKLQSPKQTENREIRLLTQRLIATSPRVASCSRP